MTAKDFYRISTISPTTFVQLFRTGSTRVVYIYGVHARKFLCMNKRGKVVGMKSYSDRCKFTVHELLENFKSFSHRHKRKTVYFGLTKSGKPRIGKKRSARTKFVWRPVNYKEIQSLKSNPVEWLKLYRNI